MSHAEQWYNLCSCMCILKKVAQLVSFLTFIQPVLKLCALNHGIYDFVTKNVGNKKMET